MDQGSVRAVIGTQFTNLRSQYAAIVADPPWRYNATAKPMRGGGRGASAEAHYATMTNEEIAALPVESLAADRAHLYLWVTNPRLMGDYRGHRDVSPFDIVEAWGFTPVTLITWVKGNPDLQEAARNGTGWYFRGCTEHIVFGVRGKLGIPPALRQPNVLIAPRRKHSAKPPEFFALAESVSPAPRLELFGRTMRPGWDVLGNELQADDDLFSSDGYALTGIAP